MNRKNQEINLINLSNHVINSLNPQKVFIQISIINKLKNKLDLKEI